VPTYQYDCTECGEQLEVVQKFTDDSLSVCPACQGRLRKVFSPVGVLFKGSGFYRNDSRSKAASSTTSSSEKASEKASGASTGSAESSTSTASPAPGSSTTKSSTTKTESAA